VGSYRYRITVRGGLGEIYRQAFAGFAVDTDGTDTVLIGDLDQAALYGTLDRINSLGLELLELARVDEAGSA
jgi:hypothetical protein